MLSGPLHVSVYARANDPIDAIRGRRLDPTTPAFVHERFHEQIVIATLDLRGDGPPDVGLAEIIPFEQKGVVSVNRYRIGKAVTEVELGFVASLSILEVRTRRGLDVIASERYHLDAGVADQFEQLLRTGDTVAPEYDDGCFDQGRGSDEEVAGVLGKDDFQSLGIGFIFDDRDESRGVDDHLPRQSALVVEVFLLEVFEERKVPDFSRELVDVRA